MKSIVYITLLALILALICLIKPADSIGCYVCKETDSGCGMSFNYVTSVVQIQTDCNYCTKSFYNILGTDHVTRGCAKDSLLQTSCVDATVMGYGGSQCSCNSNLCNSAARPGLAAALIAIIAAVIRLVVVT